MTRLQPDASGFIDLSQVAPGVGAGFADAYSGRQSPSFDEAGAGDFGGTTAADIPADPVELQSGAVKALQGGLIELQPDQRASYGTGGLAPQPAMDFLGSVEGSIMGLGAGLASGVSRAANFLSGGLIDLTDSAGPDDPRITELLASDLPEERSAGEMMLRKKREAEAAGRAGFQAETSRIASTPQPGTNPDSWASFAGRVAGGIVPSAVGVLNPIAGAAVIGTFGMNAYESAYDRYVNKSVEQTGTFDPVKANAIGIASGAVEALVEMLPIKAAKVFGERAVKEAIDAIASGGSRLVAAKALAKGVAATAGVEGGEEATSEVVNSILEVMYDRDLQKQYEEDPQAALTEAAGRVLSAFGQGALGGALLGGAGVSRAVAMGVDAAPRRGATLEQSRGPGKAPPPESNYATDLGEYADSVYRETSVSGALELLPESGVTTPTGDVYLSHTKDLALGQGNNKGVLLEIDPRGIVGQINRSKPTWQASWENGQAEYVARRNSQGAFQNAVKSFTILPSATVDRVGNAAIRRTIAALETKGWAKETLPDGSRKWTRPESLAQPGTGKGGPPPKAGPVMEWNPENVAKALDVPPEQAHAVVALANAMGLDASRLRAQRGGETTGASAAKGQVEFKASGEAIIRGISSPDVSTGVHELSHVARRWLLDRNVPAAERTGITDQDIADAESWAGVGADGKWSVQHEEKLARGFEKYLRNGQAPTPRLASLFQKFREWMLRIYQKIAGSPLDVKVSPEMRRVFDSLVQRGSVAQAPLPDLYRAALGEGYAETTPETQSRPSRVARPDAIAALVKADLWPKSTTPDDLALEILSDKKYEPIVHLLVNKRDLSRSDATWLFGANNKEMGDKGNRAKWLAAFKELAPKTAWNVPSFLTDLAAPPRTPAGGPPAAAASGEVGLRTDRLTRFQRSVQDSLIQVFRLAQDVTPGRELDAGSPVPVMRTLNARISDEQRRLGEERINPLLARMAETGITGDRVAQYLIARHVPEANQVAARRNPDNHAVASGMTDARAAQVVAMESRAPDFAVLDEIASGWRQILRDEFQSSHEAGMMTDVERAAMEQYRNYVPIMDDPEYLESVDMVDEQGNVQRKRLSVGKTQFIKRTGRTQGMLDNPETPRAKALFEGFLANVMTVTERRISRRQRNDFGNVLRTWLAANPKARGAMQVVAEPPLVDAVVDGEVQRVPDSTYRDRDDVLHFKASEDFSVGDKDIRKGETFYIEVADPALGKQMKLATEIGEEGWKFLAGAMHMATRTLTVGATGPLALSFHVDNLIRDIGDITGTIGAQVKAHQVKGYVYRQFRRNMGRSFRSLMGGTRDREIQQFRDEWERLGGRMQMLGPIEFAAAKRRIDSALNPSAGTSVKNVASALRNGIRVAVSPFESSTKLAYFASLRQNGVPAEKAAAMTRDVMDYEKRGTMTGPLRVAYAFVNPSIQGTERQIASLSAKPARLLLAASFTAGLLSALQGKIAITNMWGDDDDENEMPDWMQRLDYEKRMRHRIPLGAAADALGIENDLPDVFSVPVPYSQQMANMLGVMIGEWATGQRSSVNALKEIADSAADIYWPIGGSNVYKGFAPLMQSVSPSAVRPMTDLAVNRNWYGGTIYNEPYPGQEAGWVAAENPRQGTARFWTDFAQWMERNVGVDMPPETVPYLISSMFSTTGKDAAGVFEMLTDIADGDASTDPAERFPNKIPVLRKYLMEGGNPAYVRQEYDRYAMMAARYDRTLKSIYDKRAAATDPAERDALAKELRSKQDAWLTSVAKEIADADSRIASARNENRKARRAYEAADAAGDERAKAKAQAKIDQGREDIAIIMGRATARISGRKKPASASERKDQTASRGGS